MLSAFPSTIAAGPPSRDDRHQLSDPAERVDRVDARRNRHALRSQPRCGGVRRGGNDGQDLLVSPALLHSAGLQRPAIRCSRTPKSDARSTRRSTGTRSSVTAWRAAAGRPTGRSGRSTGPTPPRRRLRVQPRRRASAALERPRPKRATGRDGSVPRRLSFTCLVFANDPRFERLAVLVQKQLADVGVDMKLRAGAARGAGGRGCRAATSTRFCSRWPAGR